jgi:hypothetical protein
VIEKQHILHVLELHAQHNILYIYIYTSVNPVPNAQVCVYLTIHITKLQLQTNENINIVIEFNLYVPKFSKSKIQAPNRNLQIILII